MAGEGAPTAKQLEPALYEPKTIISGVDMMKIKIAINRSFQGKPKKPIPEAFWREYNGRFSNKSLTAEEVAAEIASGHGISTQHKRYRKRSNFICGQHLGLDFDTEDDASRIDTLLADPFIWKYASILYKTPSHTHDKPRARVIFFLDKAIFDPVTYTELAEALVWCYGQADQSCKDPARLFFGALPGSDPVVLNNVLPFNVAHEYIMLPYRERESQKVLPVSANRERQVIAAANIPVEILENHSEKLLARVRNASDGEKHAILRDISRTFGGYVASGYYSENEVTRWLQDAIAANPGNVADLRAARRTIEKSLQYGQGQPLEITYQPKEENKSKYELDTSWQEQYPAMFID